MDCGKTALQKIVGAGGFNVYWLDSMLYNRYFLVYGGLCSRLRSNRIVDSTYVVRFPICNTGHFKTWIGSVAESKIKKNN